jgi:Histidine-specific methyltransferase, SAM-dependent
MDAAEIQTAKSFSGSEIALYERPDVGALVRDQARTGLLESDALFADDEDWAHVADDASYSYYKACLHTLDAMLATESWRQRSRAVRSYIDLGVGTGEKLRRFAARTLSDTAPDRLGLILLDVNARMLAAARHGLTAGLIASGTVDLVTAHARFEQLNQVMRHPAIRATGWAGSQAAFLLLGNTFGNLHEERMLGLLRSVAKRDDLLILSLELGAVGPALNDMDEIVERYRKSKTIHAIFSSPLKYLEGSVSPLDITWIEADARLTSLPGTRTVVGRVFVDGREVIVARSNRYDQDELLRLFLRHGFMPLEAHYRRETGFYRYLIFRKQ